MLLLIIAITLLYKDLLTMGGKGCSVQGHFGILLRQCVNIHLIDLEYWLQIMALLHLNYLRIVNFI